MKFVVDGNTESNKQEEKEGKKLRSRIKASQSIEEALELMDQLPESQSAAFYIATDQDGKAVIQELTNKKKLKLMDEIIGEKIQLREGESRESKIYRLTVTFSDLLELALEQNLEVVLNQVESDKLADTKAAQGGNSVCVMDDGEFYVWTFPDDPNEAHQPKVKVFDTSAKKRKPRKVKDKKMFLEFQQENPVQLSLFRLLAKEKDYSHTVELYDFIPKYVWGKSSRIEGKFLDPIQRKFVCKGVTYKVTLMPAKIQTESSEYLDHFPGKREELVEDALRKLMSDAYGVFLDDAAGTTFTLYQLQTELKSRGHSYSYDQLKDSLEILAKTDIELESEDQETKIIFRPIETLGLSGKDGETQTFVRFSPLVTQSIKKGSYRLINYDKVMSYKTTIARQLHKRMSHFYTQASLTEKYHILLSTIIRDFGLTRYAQLRNNLSEVEKSLDEMKEKNVVLNCVIDRVFDAKPKTKLIDAKFTFQPHPYFIDEIKKANAKYSIIKEQLKNSSSDYE